jgi:hypothetical protein
MRGSQDKCKGKLCAAALPSLEHNIGKVLKDKALKICLNT